MNAPNYVVDLFAGAGGADEGVRRAGHLGPIVGIETDRDACRTATDAGHWRIRADVATYPAEAFAGKVDGLWASPPCQTFSRAGKRAGLSDARGELVWQPLRWTRELMPRWVVCEQVEDVLPIWQIIAAGLREVGYSTWTGRLNAADYGVPQVRIRAVLVGRLDAVARPPAPTHGRDSLVDLTGHHVKPWVTMAEALGWTPEVAYRRTRGAGLLVRHGDRPDTPVTEPAPTITGKSRSDVWVLTRPATTELGDSRIGRPGHKGWERGGESMFARGSVTVTPNEAAALQDFRDGYPWFGSKSSRHQQIGNAVPVGLAAAVVAPMVKASVSERAA